MKRYIYGFFAFLTTMLGVWALTGCSADVEPFVPEESGRNCFSLVVTVPEEDSTRATTDSFNEFKVKTLHFYFYKNDGHDDAASLSVYDCVWAEEAFDTKRTVRVALPANALLEGGLFGTSGTQCIVYAVANVDLPENTAKTVDELKATAIVSTFAQTKVQESFAMDGKATVTLTRDERRATGHIELTRAAAKITLSVDLPASITVNAGTEAERTYTSNAENMHVWIGNGVRNSVLNTAAAEAAEADLYSNTIEAVKNEGTDFARNDGAEKYKYVQNVPFYSYPSKWEAATPNGNCYLTLMVHWKYTDEQGNTVGGPTYYRIAVQPTECKIERNTHYDIRVTIGRIGESDPQKPVDMEFDWNYAIPWKSHTISADIKEVRYLLLNSNYYDDTITNPDESKGAYAFEMNNTTEIEIPVGTSHDVKIASVTMSWIDYSENPVAKRSVTLTPDGVNKYTDWAGYNESTQTSFLAGIEADNGVSKLKLKREMLHLQGGGQKWVVTGGHWEGSGRNRHWVEEGYYEDLPVSITKNAALNAYTFDIELQHSDDATQTAKVRITQYPPIYITAEETTSSKYRFVNGENSGSPGDGLGSIGEKSNHNTYIISISRFESNEDNYVIADPRSRSIDNNLEPNNSSSDAASWSAKGYTTKPEEKQRRLTYYYPADPSSSKTNYIAPKFRIASQYGVTTKISSSQGARRRCASYQENGRPAGRWRLPTKAEIKYIATLSCKGYIPYLFGDRNGQADYWCASGAINVINGNSPTVEDATGSSHYVRCVYDEWYWGNDVLEDKNEFRWGDRPRTTSGN